MSQKGDKDVNMFEFRGILAWVMQIPGEIWGIYESAITISVSVGETTKVYAKLNSRHRKNRNTFVSMSLRVVEDKTNLYIQ